MQQWRMLTVHVGAYLPYYMHPKPHYSGTQAQPYYREDINAGSDEEPDMTPTGLPAAGDTIGPMPGASTSAPATTVNPFAGGRAAVRNAYARALGPQGFEELLGRIEGAYQQVGLA